MAPLTMAPLTMAPLTTAPLTMALLTMAPLHRFLRQAGPESDTGFHRGASISMLSQFSHENEGE